MNLSGGARSLGFVSILLVAAGPLLAHFRVLAPAAGFGLFSLGLLLGLVAFAVGWFGFAAARRTGAPRGPAVQGLVAGAVILLLMTALFITRGFRTTPAGCTDLASCSAAAIDTFYAAAYRPNKFVVDQLREFSPINDISTNLEDPPTFLVASVRGGDWDFPEASQRRQQELYPDVKTIYAGGQPKENFVIVRDAAREKGWTIQLQRPDFFAFEATTESKIFRFVDDISVRMYASPRCPRPMNGRCNSTAVDIRSKSRDGLSDIGKNANRILDFTARIRELTVESAPPRAPEL
ncbi:MAG: DUF1499 domain-containing protein [Myxococcales bacterium]|nr:DUF1499 domain-containing protein [Myxococcales bacterium]